MNCVLPEKLDEERLGRRRAGQILPKTHDRQVWEEEEWVRFFPENERSKSGKKRGKHIVI